MKEIFKVIKEFPDYQISDLGRVLSNRTSKSKILKPRLDKSGYLGVTLCGFDGVKTRTIHQLVAVAFLNHTPCGFDLVVNHKNFIKTDNRVENLEIVTSRDNLNQKHRKSSSKYTGVSWCKASGKWRSAIYRKGKVKHIGLFESESEASNSYQKELNYLLSFKNNY